MYFAKLLGRLLVFVTKQYTFWISAPLKVLYYDTFDDRITKVVSYDIERLTSKVEYSTTWFDIVNYYMTYAFTGLDKWSPNKLVVNQSANIIYEIYAMKGKRFFVRDMPADGLTIEKLKTIVSEKEKTKYLYIGCSGTDVTTYLTGSTSYTSKDVSFSAKEMMTLVYLSGITPAHKLLESFLKYNRFGHLNIVCIHKFTLEETLYKDIELFKL
jgi:hypothetical protein